MAREKGDLMDAKVQRLLARCSTTPAEAAQALGLDPAVLALDPAPQYVWHAIRSFCANERENQWMELPEDLRVVRLEGELRQLRWQLSTLRSVLAGCRKTIADLTAHISDPVS